jgi:hypothetical protein
MHGLSLRPAPTVDRTLKVDCILYAYEAVGVPSGPTSGDGKATLS